MTNLDEAVVVSPAESGHWKAQQASPIPQEATIALLGKHSKELKELIESIAGQVLDAKKVQIRFSVHLAWMGVAVILVMVIAATWLTFAGKMADSTLSFLFGLVVGALLNVVRAAMGTQ